MTFSVRYTEAAEEDLLRLYTFLAQQNIASAERALIAIRKGIDFLRDFPFACRKADLENPLLRELVISFGASGYLVLYEIDDHCTVTILAVRHQREDDYH